jgi:hypothetical protein
MLRPVGNTLRDAALEIFMQILARQNCISVSTKIILAKWVKDQLSIDHTEIIHAAARPHPSSHKLISGTWRLSTGPFTVGLFTPLLIDWFGSFLFLSRE